MSQMENDMEDLKRLVASMAQLLKNQSESKAVAVDRSTELSIASLNSIESRIQEFVYSPEDGATFEKWWNRHEDIFMIDLKELDEVKKIRLLIRHISTMVERTFTESIAPTKWIDMNLEQVKTKMLTLFGDNTSIFDRRRTMLDLKMSKENIEDVRVLAARVNQTVENAQVKDATINEWKVLTFLHSLDLPRYSDVHLKMMQTAKEKGNKCTLDDLLSVFNDMSQLKKDSRTITESSREVNYVDRRTRQHQSQRQHQRDSSADSEGTVQDGHTACYCCGNEGHTSSNCRFRSVKCNNCGTKGHLARVCKKTKNVNTVSVASVVTPSYRIQVEINGLPTSMAIDTGADITIVSDETWKHLGSPAYECDSGTVKCANGDDLKLRGRFIARMEYGGMCATSDVYVVHGRMDLLGKNFIKLLQLVKVRAPEAKNDELVKANEPEANVRLVKAGVPEAKHVNLVKIHGSEANECNIVKVPEPETIEINRVKVECEAESFRGHTDPEAIVKVSEPAANDRSTEIETMVNFPPADENEQLSSRAYERIREDSVMDQNLKGFIPEMDLVNEIERNLVTWNSASATTTAISSLLSFTSSTTREGITDHVNEGKPHKKTNEGKSRKKMNEGKPHKETKQWPNKQFGFDSMNKTIQLITGKYKDDWEVTKFVADLTREVARKPRIEIVDNSTVTDPLKYLMVGDGWVIGDWMYVPTSNITFVAMFAQLAHEGELFHELFTSKIMHILPSEGSTEADPTRVRFLWGTERTNWTEKYSAEQHGLHPAKLTEFQKFPERAKFCDAVLDKFYHNIFRIGNWT